MIGFIKLLTLLLILTLIWLGLKLICRLYGLFSSHNASSNRKKAFDSKKILKCSKCDIYIPEKNAFFIDGKPYCSPEHAKPNEKSNDG